jgi:hypothetical protein
LDASTYGVSDVADQADWADLSQSETSLFTARGCMLLLGAATIWSLDSVLQANLVEMAERRPLAHEDLTRSLIGSFFECYNHIGFGFVESICVAALEEELRQRGHHVAREVAVSVSYKVSTSAGNAWT